MKVLHEIASVIVLLALCFGWVLHPTTSFWRRKR